MPALPDGLAVIVKRDCPTCVMEPDALGLMMHDMLRDHAPQIDEVVVLVTRTAGGSPA